VSRRYLSFEAAHVNLSGDLATKIEATRDAAVETIADVPQTACNLRGDGKSLRRV